MVRRCAVANCASTDITILSHRFPKNLTNSLRWQQSLQLMDISIEELLSKYVVCTKHFEASDYKNSLAHTLNLTATPKLRSESQNRIQNQLINSNLIEICPEHLEQNIAFVPIDNECVNQLNSDLVNDDIMILSENGIIQFEGEEQDQTKSLLQSVDLTDYHKVNMVDLDNIYIPDCDESNEISLINNTSNIKYESQTSDSEVEVLFFDEMIEQAAFSIDEERTALESSISEISPSSFDKDLPVGLFNIDFSCQVDMSEFEEDGLYKNFTKDELVQHIIGQNSQIKELKRTLETYEHMHSMIAQNINNIRNLMNEK